MTNDVAMVLSEAIILQAVDDWKALCAGAGETKLMNLSELWEFFTIELDLFLTGTSIHDVDVQRRMQKLWEESMLFA